MGPERFDCKSLELELAAQNISLSGAFCRYGHASSGGCEIRSVEFVIHERGSIHGEFNLLNLDFMFIFIAANNLRYFIHFQISSYSVGSEIAMG
jgi:hypothetical protein